MSERSKKCDFTNSEREYIRERDWAGCIFCRNGYRIEKSTWEERNIFEIMHYIPRSQGGLGIKQNAAVGCKFHHQMYDNGLHHNEMKEIFRKYLMQQYPDWDEDGLVYRKEIKKQADNVISVRKCSGCAVWDAKRNRWKCPFGRKPCIREK